MWLRSTKYILDGPSRLPMIVGAVGWVSIACSAVKQQSYPASQNWPTDRRDRYVRFGKMVAWRAMAGRLSFGSWAEHEEVMVAPLGVPALMGRVV